MSDDIVTRLRKQSIFYKSHRFGDLLEDWAGEAADEIERLRELVQLLHKMADDLMEETRLCGSFHDAAATNNYAQWVQDNE